MGSVYGNRYFYGWQGGLENVRSALAAFERALAIEPDLVAAQRGLILVKWEVEPSEELLKRGMALRELFERTGDPEALQGYAESLVLGGFAREAAVQFRRALQLDPASRGAQWFLTMSAAWAGDWREAVSAGQTYFDKFGDDAEVHLWVGVAQEMLGDLPRAGVHYARAVELFPPGTLRDDLVYPALFFRRQGQADKADSILLDVLETATLRLERWPDHPRLLHTAVQASALLGDTNGAAGLLQRMRKEFPTTAPAFTQATPGIGGAGDAAGALRLAAEGIRLGCLIDVTLVLAPLWAGRPVDQLPGGSELLAQLAAARAPLRAKYVR
jgi:tetratricopeptide (TPR) repeat protein